MEDKNWPFNVPENIGCITTKQVMQQGLPILAILHDEDGAWQVLCDTTENPDDGMLVDLGCLYQRFPLLKEFANIPRGYEAVRETEASEWVVIKTEYDYE